MKPIILTFTGFYLPGYRGGGPIRTIANMVECLGGDFDFRIVTTDRDMGESQPYPNIQIDAWNIVGKAKVFYASTATRSLLGLAKILRETPHDLLYLNSFFDPKFTLRLILARRLGLAPKRPLLIAPRGEFSAGALGIKSWKKKPFLRLARITGFFEKAYWHASTESELTDIQRGIFVCHERVHIAKNIAVAPDLLQKAQQVFDPTIKINGPRDQLLRVCFLSRIAPMKNLEFALRVLGRVNVLVEFRIFGPKEDANYWEKCQQLIECLPPNVKAVYCGSVAHAEVRKVISTHDIFFVPSLGENFGHVFMEALSVGVPILVSDRTPWRDLERQGIGWDISLEQPEKFISAIEAAANFSAVLRHQMKLNCLDYALKKAEDSSILALNRALFTQALATGLPDKTI